MTILLTTSDFSGGTAALRQRASIKIRRQAHLRGMQVTYHAHSPGGSAGNWYMSVSISTPSAIFVNDNTGVLFAAMGSIPAAAGAMEYANVFVPQDQDLALDQRIYIFDQADVTVNVGLTAVLFFD